MHESIQSIEEGGNNNERDSSNGTE
jgi:hypothetical protein